MIQKIRVTTKAEQSEQRNQEHLRAGYQVEDEQPLPLNGLRSFTAVKPTTDQDSSR